MTSSPSSYSYNSQSYFSGDDSDRISQNIINNSNSNKNRYRTSLFIEESPDSRRQTISSTQLNIINRTSTHSFMVFIDDSIYGNIPSSSASLWSDVVSSSSNANIGSSNNNSRIDTGLVNNEENKRPENITFRSTNLTDTHDNVPFVHNDLSKANSPTITTNPSYSSNIHTVNIIQSPTTNREPSVILRHKEDDLLLRPKITLESMSTGNTEYFETNESITSTTNNNFNEDNIPSLSTSTRDTHFNITNNENSAYNMNGNSTDSIDTQNTEILDTRIRNSQSLIRNIRDSIKTLSTIVPTQNPDSSITAKRNSKTLSSVNQNDEIVDTSMQEETFPRRQLTVRNRTPPLSLEISSNFSNIFPRNSSQINNPSTEIDQMSGAEPSYSSIFQYDDYNDTVEPDIEQAVKLLKKEVKTSTPRVNYVHSESDPDNIFIQGSKKKSEKEEKLTDTDSMSIKSRGSSAKLILHELKIPNRLSFSQPQTPIIAPSESHVPRSPSLINKILVASSSKMKASQTFPSYKSHKRNISLTNHAIVTPLYGSISFDTKIPSTSSTHSTTIPKVQVLQSVSGPSRWKPSPKTESHIVSILGSNEFKNPIKKLSFHEDMRDSLHESTSIWHPNTSNIEQLAHSEPDKIIHETSTFRNNLFNTPTTINHPHTNIVPPLPTGVTMFRCNTTMEIPEGTMADYNNNNTNSTGINIDTTTNIPNNDNMGYPMYIQHIDSPSIHSFDSQNYKFWEIYSIQRMISLLIICCIVPPLFFMIYMGSTCGIDDYKLMKLILNKEHRIGLFHGFLWDIDLNWLRTLSLLLGCVELVIVFACIGIGFGVGLTR